MFAMTNINKFYQSAENIIFLLIFLISFLISLIIFLSLSGYLLNLGQVDNVSLLISTNFFLIILLIFISLNKILKSFIQKKKKIKSKFRIQFTSLFIIISFIPTTLITIFSLIFLIKV